MKYDALYLLDADIDNISDGINSFFEIQINKMKMKDTIKNQFSGIEKSDYDRIYDSIDQYAKIIERLIWEIKKSFKTQLQSPSS